MAGTRAPVDLRAHDPSPRHVPRDEAVTGGIARRLRSLFGPSSQHRPLGVLVGMGPVVLLSVASAWLLPRGPLVTPQALVLLGGALFVGTVAGLALRTRWAALAAPATFAFVYELRWLGIDGPMTDLPPFDSILTLLVLGLGRGWLAVLVLAPMAFGVLLGTARARRFDGGTRDDGGIRDGGRHLGGRIGTGLATIAIVALVAGLVRPVGTPAIVDAAGVPLPDSIAELTTVTLGGHEQALLLRGEDVANPVLIALEGGPGGSGIGAMRLFGSELERDFVVASWDQRATGKSYPALEPRETLTVDQVVADLVELTDLLRERFDEDRVYLLGNSWGTTLAVLAAQQHPDRFHAIVGTGQMVSQRETDRLMYDAMVTEARTAGDTARVGQLEELGPPPFARISDYAPLLVQPADRPDVEWPANTFVREYSLLEQINTFPALIETFATLYPQLQTIDFRSDATRLEVPVHVVDGVDEDPARSTLTAEWLGLLEAPEVTYEVLDGAGHRPHLQQPEAFAEVMRRVLDGTRPR